MTTGRWQAQQICSPRHDDIADRSAVTTKQVLLGRQSERETLKIESKQTPKRSEVQNFEQLRTRKLDGRLVKHSRTCSSATFTDSSSCTPSQTSSSFVSHQALRLSCTQGTPFVDCCNLALAEFLVSRTPIRAMSDSPSTSIPQPLPASAAPTPAAETSVAALEEVAQTEPMLEVKLEGEVAMPAAESGVAPPLDSPAAPIANGSVGESEMSTGSSSPEPEVVSEAAAHEATGTTRTQVQSALDAAIAATLAANGEGEHEVQGSPPAALTGSTSGCADAIMSEITVLDPVPSTSSTPVPISATRPTRFSSNPLDPQTLLEQGRAAALAFAAKTKGQALSRVAQLQARIEKDPLDGEARLALIQDAEKKGDLERTREVYESFLSVFPDAVSWSLEQAMLCSRIQVERREDSVGASTDGVLVMIGSALDCICESRAVTLPLRPSRIHFRPLSPIVYRRRALEILRRLHPPRESHRPQLYGQSKGSSRCHLESVRLRFVARWARSKSRRSVDGVHRVPEARRRAHLFSTNRTGFRLRRLPGIESRNMGRPATNGRPSESIPAGRRHPAQQRRADLAGVQSVREQSQQDDGASRPISPFHRVRICAVVVFLRRFARIQPGCFPVPRGPLLRYAY